MRHRKKTKEGEETEEQIIKKEKKEEIKRNAERRKNK